MMKKIVISTIIIACNFSLVGCAIPLSRQPTEKICLDYLSLPSLQIGQTARADELKSRKATCSADQNSKTARPKNDKVFETKLRSFLYQNY